MTEAANPDNYNVLRNTILYHIIEAWKYVHDLSPEGTEMLEEYLKKLNMPDSWLLFQLQKATEEVVTFTLSKNPNHGLSRDVGRMYQ